MIKFFSEVKKPYFWHIFQILRAKIFPHKNLDLSHITSYGFLVPQQNLEKIMNNSKKTPKEKVGRMEGWTDPIS